ncbi:MAG: hypothetical protein QOK36_1349 [Gaiellales bacterium]|nr:hypothetical protein [Gaiellales bacterium]
MNAGEQLVRKRLRGYEAPGEVEAGERGRRLLLAAYAERTRSRRRRRCLPRMSWPVLAALLTALTAGAIAVAGHLRDGGSSRASRASFAPAELEGGVVLALGNGVAYTVTARGRVRALGPAADGDLSPRGLNAVLASGSGLVAVHVADGQVRWRVPAPGPVSLPRWSLERMVPPCCRVAYLAAGALFVVGGDGRGSRRVAAHALAVAPAWRPRGAAHELAYVAPGGIRIAATDGDRPQRRVPAARNPIGLSWRADGRVFAAVDRTGVTLYRADGRRLQRVAVRGGTAIGGSFTRAGNRLVVLRRDANGRVTLLVRGAAGPLRAVRHLTLTAVGDLRLSPDGRHALLASREGDEWVDIRLRDGHVRVLRDIGRRLRAGFAPQALAWAR